MVCGASGKDGGNVGVACPQRLPHDIQEHCGEQRYDDTHLDTPQYATSYDIHIVYDDRLVPTRGRQVR